MALNLSATATHLIVGLIVSSLVRWLLLCLLHVIYSTTRAPNRCLWIEIVVCQPDRRWSPITIHRRLHRLLLHLILLIVAGLLTLAIKMHLLRGWHVVEACVHAPRRLREVLVGARRRVVSVGLRGQVLVTLHHHTRLLLLNHLGLVTWMELLLCRMRESTVTPLVKVDAIVLGLEL